MNNLENKIQEELVQAMKAKETTTVSALRAIKTAIMQTKTAANGKKELEDADIIKIIQKQVKERRESAEIYKSANRMDLADQELSEAKILDDMFLPKMLSESEIELIVNKTIEEVGATTMKDMGRVMGAINKKYAGQVDGSTVSKIVKNKLS